MTRTYRIAEKNIRICSEYADVHELCQDYLTDAAPDLEIRITPSDLQYEREHTESEQAGGYYNPVHGTFASGDSPDRFLETLAVYRKISEQMPYWDTILVHGSAVSVDNAAYLFTAPSGTGKSTHVRLWRELFGSRAQVVNDDKPLVLVSDGAVTVFGTPWNGKHHLGTNMSAPLHAICFLKRSKTNDLRPVSADEALPLLLKQVYRPRDPASLALVLRLVETLRRSVAFFELHCNMELDAARLAYETMKGSHYETKL